MQLYDSHEGIRSLILIDSLVACGKRASMDGVRGASNLPLSRNGRATIITISIKEKWLISFWLKVGGCSCYLRAVGKLGWTVPRFVDASDFLPIT